MFYNYKHLFILCLSIVVTGCGSGLCPLRNGTGVCARGSSGWAFDSSFGSNGLVRIPYADVGLLLFSGNSAALQPDGKFVLAGDGAVVNLDFTAIRLTSTGAIDTSFNGTGQASINVGSTIDTARSVAIQSDGKIVLTGNVFLAGWDIAVARFNSNGTADTSFNGTGFLTRNISGSDLANKTLLQPDGKIIILGYSNTNFLIMRYLSNGTLDTSFNTVGYTVTDLGATEGLVSGVIQPDGKIVAAGVANNNFAVARYDTNGTLDTSFGTAGVVTTSIYAGADQVNDVKLQSDNKIVVGGYGDDGVNYNCVIARYTTSGVLDTTFGNGGTTITSFGALNRINELQIQPDDKIIASAGYLMNDPAYLIRYTANGTIDQTFGSNGLISYSTMAPFSVKLQPDGRIVFFGDDNEITILRYRYY